MRIILLGAPFMICQFVLNNQLRFQGSAFYSMIGIATGAVINIGLDPLLIFTFKMGIAGAALATIISQFVSFCLLLAGTRRGGNLQVRLRNFSPTASSPAVKVPQLPLLAPAPPQRFMDARIISSGIQSK